MQSAHRREQESMQNQMIVSEGSTRCSLREGALEEEEEGKPNEGKMKCEETSGEKSCHCSLENISAYAPIAFSQPCYLQDVKVLLLCVWERKEVKYTPRQCEQMPLHFFFTDAALSKGHWSAG